MERLGNWYHVPMDGNHYQVLVQKEPNSFICEPSSILVFDEMFDKVEDESVWKRIEEIMNRVDWKYDVVDEEEFV